MTRESNSCYKKQNLSDAPKMLEELVGDLTNLTKAGISYSMAAEANKSNQVLMHGGSAVPALKEMLDRIINNTSSLLSMIGTSSIIMLATPVGGKEGQHGEVVVDGEFDVSVPVAISMPMIKGPRGSASQIEREMSAGLIAELGHALEMLKKATGRAKVEEVDNAEQVVDDLLKKIEGNDSIGCDG